jgi:hypothetical protein
MAPEIPTVNLSSVQELDLITTYYMLYQYMAEEFVHKGDLQNILDGNSVSGTCENPAGVGTIVGIAAFVGNDSVVRNKARAYQELVNSGRVAREGMISGLNAITNSKSSS